MPPRADTSLPPEDYLIILCCSIKPEPHITAAITNLLSPHLDWGYIYTTTQQHDISSLFFNNIARCENIGCVPSAIIEKFKKKNNATAITNILLLKEYHAIIKKFHAENINIIPLKGIAFLKMLYHNIALRSLSDIDILVQKQDICKAEEILKELGFNLKPETFSLRGKHFHSVFYKQKNKLNVVIELHWHIDVADSPFRIPIEDFWNRVEPFQDRDNGLCGLSCEDTLLINCFHVLRDRGEGKILSLKNLCDISEIIKLHKENLNWELLLERAQEYKILRIVLLVLLFIEKLFFAFLPASVMEKTKGEQPGDTMLDLLIKENIFIKKKESFFLPQGLVVSSQEDITLGFNPKSIIKTMYYNLRTRYEQHNSLLKTLKTSFLFFYKSLINYISLICVLLTNYNKFITIVNDRFKTKKKLADIEKWLSD